MPDGLGPCIIRPPSLNVAFRSPITLASPESRRPLHRLQIGSNRVAGRTHDLISIPYTQPTNLHVSTSIDAIAMREEPTLLL